MALVLGIPFLLRSRADESAPRNVRTLVVITPHVPQIQEEFARGFASWHERRYGEPAWIDFRQPGGTSEILKLLKAQYVAAAQHRIDTLRTTSPETLLTPGLSLNDLFAPGDIPFDVMFGGGTYDHSLLADTREGTLWFRPFPDRGVETVTIAVPAAFDFPALRGTSPVTLTVTVDGATLSLRVPPRAFRADDLDALRDPAVRSVDARLDLSACEASATFTMAAPWGFAQERLDAWFRQPDGTSPNAIGAGRLYHPEQYWLGTALSGFGIVFNREVLHRLDIADPDSFADLCDPRLQGWVALADPRMSGSIETTFESILDNEGWDAGWRILRGMCANARYVTDMSTKPPLDVAHGEAAMGLAIDFYGRSQSQAVMQEGETPDTSRVGYVDPAGKVFIDPDPITLLRGSRDPELARRFCEFVLSDEGQALWQFHATQTDAGASNPPIPGASGADGSPLLLGPRRHELRRMPVRRAFIHDQWDSLIDKVDPYDLASTQKPRGWRSAIKPMMSAFGIDTASELHSAWRAYHEAVGRGAEPWRLAAMESALYAFPDGHRVEQLWDEMFPGERARPEGAFVDFTPENYRAIRETWRNPRWASRLQIVYTRICRENYRRVLDLVDAAPPMIDPPTLPSPEGQTNR